MAEVFVAAGSNIEPQDKLRLALALLRERFGALHVSRAYRNRAVGFNGDDFVNLAVGFSTDAAIEEVVKTLQQIEEHCGRPRTAPKFAPRAMDLDLLMYDDLVRHDGIVLPRPDLTRRAYMLGPMADIAPGRKHPVLGTTFAELWRSFDRAAHPMEAIEL